MVNESPIVTSQRLCDSHDGPIVVFVIGMRINRLLRPDKWMPVARAMPAMLKELKAKPDYGFLHAELMLARPRTLLTLQYWRDAEGLLAYAHDREGLHMPAWHAFNRAAKGNDAVGIFHETYTVPAGGHESIYIGMTPPFGLGQATGLIPASGKRNDARGRLGD